MGGLGALKGLGKNLAIELFIEFNHDQLIMTFRNFLEQITAEEIPDFVKGYPLVFFTAALMSLAFMGFSGLFGVH